MPKRIKKPIPRKIVLRLPDLDHAKSSVLNSLSSPRSRRNYGIEGTGPETSRGDDDGDAERSRGLAGLTERRHGLRRPVPLGAVPKGLEGLGQRAPG
jgi:hypothetical protein